MRRFENSQPLSSALSLSLSRVTPLSESEEIAVPEAYGRVLAEEIFSSSNLPGFVRATMDGYAVRAQDTHNASHERPAILKVIGSVEMGEEPQKLPALQESEAIEITTGGPVPPNADAVVMLEETETLSDSVKVFASVEPGRHLLAADSDFQRGERVFYMGHRLRAIDIGALIALGRESVRVFKRVRVGVLNTGSELVSGRESPPPGKIRETNSYVLRGLIEAQGAKTQSYPIVPDDKSRLRAAVEQAVHETDFVLISGGSSVGARDWTFEVLQELGEVLVHGLQIRPGKPTISALIVQKPVVGLPGNPVSCALVFEKFVCPLLSKRSGVRVLLPAHRLVPARLLSKIESVKGREDFLAVRLKLDEDSGALFAEPIYGHTNNISTLVRADGIVSVPADLEKIEAGLTVWVELL
ncbi:molybdopterin molybdotransferase MoeA [Candidatus Acetothermia bacterium]|jgi:molybdopterin molybdotransferase|nr:molybdopterin molybdotransferase MoeA [Candidatus Acetothermia bacterium]MCI2432724.1 molybdopterin molybdotransferase MoeA [Candidatus Acetothermia bacterium]MCI2435956.1 molybdopterin molybdotransferase MoeA [Candidatus Acetothermia bacterium]